MMVISFCSVNVNEVVEMCSNSAYGVVSATEDHVYEVIGQQKP